MTLARLGTRFVNTKCYCGILWPEVESCDQQQYVRYNDDGTPGQLVYLFTFTKTVTISGSVGQSLTVSNQNIARLNILAEPTLVKI